MSTASALLVCLLGAASAQTAPLSLTLRSAGSLSLTAGRTQGGIGGGVGLSYELKPSVALQADVAWLWGIGAPVLVRVGGAWQRAGLWRPQLRADLEVGLGGGLEFSVEGRIPPRAPTLGGVLGLGLLRFEVPERGWISLLELSGGLSTDFASLGPRLGLSLLSLGVRL